jgi:hypothetical protein
MVDRVQKSIGFLVAILLELFAAYTHNPQDDESPEEDSANTIQDGQGTQIAPPPPPAPPPREFQPMQHQDGWPWSVEADTSWQHVVQQIIRQRNDFYVVTNGAHRQAMNEFEVATA